MRIELTLILDEVMKKLNKRTLLMNTCK